jgi:replicative DNA helicase
MSERPAPANLDAERTVLGALMLKPPVYTDIAAALAVDDFFLPAHREIFEAAGAVVARQRPCDPLMVGDELQARGMVARLPGGLGYLMDLAGGVTHTEHLGHHVSLISEASGLRRLIAICAETMSRGYGHARLGELVEEVTSAAARIVIHTPGDLVNAGDLVQEVLDDLERRHAAGPEKSITGVRTGVYALDRLTCGSDPGDLVVFAADPGGGKTALAEQAAIVTAIEEPGTALFCNLEMRKVQLVERAIAYLARRNSFNMRTGQLSVEDFREIYTAGSKISAGRLYVEDKLFTVPAIVGRAREWRARHPREKALLVVDFVQLLRSAGDEGSDNRARQLGLWCQTFKELAKMMEIVVVLVSQFNRGPAKDRRAPTMRDLRESGDIEAAADTIVLIHNPEGTEDGPVDLILEKNRKGPARRVPAHWNGRYYEFVDVGDEPEPAQRTLPGAA